MAVLISLRSWGFGDSAVGLALPSIQGLSPFGSRRAGQSGENQTMLCIHRKAAPLR